VKCAGIFAVPSLERNFANSRKILLGAHFFEVTRRMITWCDFLLRNLCSGR
jgi:hypothetical protein